jgi:pyruvate,water dikinase
MSHANNAKGAKQAKQNRFIIWFDEIGLEDINIVGGKTAALGELTQKLSEKGVKVPYGFAITSYAYRWLIQKTGIQDIIWSILRELDKSNLADLRNRASIVRELIKKTKFPVDLENAIKSAYKKLCEIYGTEKVDVAVRSSATAEDLPDASFAGQQETYLNISGEDALIDACKKCFASLFTDRAISYRRDKMISDFDVDLAIAVQKMVRADRAVAGVAFSIDTETGFKDAVLINASYGLGENVVKGSVNPDEYYVFKPTLKDGKKPVICKKIGRKELKRVYSAFGDERTRDITVPVEDRLKYVLSDDEILKIASWTCMIEEHYSRKRGVYTPVDVEWAKDGDGKIGTGEIFILQARPETVHSMRDYRKSRTYVLKEKGKVLVEGKAVGEKIGCGTANIILSPKHIGSFKRNQVLVTDMTDPDWEPIMKLASAIVTNRGGRTCHAAIVSRELGIPCVVGTEKATETIRQGSKVTVSCCEGEVGKVYEGILKYEIDEIAFDKLPSTRTQLMMNIGIPEQAFKQSQIPNEGVGLARVEFIINSYIGIHPLALVNYDSLRLRARYDSKIQNLVSEIDRRTINYSDKTDFFVSKLAEGVGMIAAAFYPKDVIVRLSDFKSNEYAKLLGGELFEPAESNPMIGWRGAARYYSDRFKDAFKLECYALKKVRDTFGLTNVKVMIPFCRTPEEGKKVIAEMEKHGLKQGEKGLEVYVMAELPSNIILADEFAKVFDGFSIGSNDLTQLILGLDRDSELVSYLYNELNPAVLNFTEYVIKTAKKHNRKVGICGQAPSDIPEFAEFLVKCGIDSISLNPDTIVRTRLKIAELEKNL